MEEQKSTCPRAEMLWRGTFGTGTLSEKRSVTSYRILVGILGCWVLAEVAISKPWPTAFKLVTVFLPAALVTFYAWEKRKYYLSLDEMARRIELEGMAWAYSLGVLAALWMGGVLFAISLTWSGIPKLQRVTAWMPLFLFGALLATVKANYRYIAARRY